MPRPRSSAVSELKAKLIARLRDGYHRPGMRFFSNRAVAKRFNVSYQTAHRLIAELVAEGWLERRPASGTYVAGRRETWQGAELIFSRRAQRPDSFGARLLARLCAALDRAGLRYRVRWGGPESCAGRIAADWYPVVWEQARLAVELAEARRYVLVMEDRPVRGIAASFADSVSVDDFSGGMAAAEFLRERLGSQRIAVLAGPDSDARNQLRVGGFLAVLPGSKVVKAGSWFYDEALRVAPRVLGFPGVFCANDRLAAAVADAAHSRGKPRPELVGFDDAPISETKGITTIAIPWEEVAVAAAEVVRRRLSGDVRTASGLIFAPRPLVRL